MFAPDPRRRKRASWEADATSWLTQERNRGPQQFRLRESTVHDGCVARDRPALGRQQNPVEAAGNGRIDSVRLRKSSQAEVVRYGQPHIAPDTTGQI